jgi:hypothetical protein
VFFRLKGGLIHDGIEIRLLASWMLHADDSWRVGGMLFPGGLGRIQSRVRTPGNETNERLACPCDQASMTILRLEWKLHE